MSEKVAEGEIAPLLSLTFGPADPELDEGDRQKVSLRLLPQVRGLVEVARADRAEDSGDEAGSKAGLATLAGMLTAEVSAKNLLGFVKWLGDRLGDKGVKIKVQKGDRVIELEAKSVAELEALKPQVEAYLQLVEAPQPPSLPPQLDRIE